jgi:hypothetical protein
MSFTEAIAVLSKAQVDLRELIQKALLEGRYSDVSNIAQLADRLARLTVADPDDGPVAYPNALAEVPADSDSAYPAPGTKLSKRDIKHLFPRFERENDRLVKISWSKRDRKEYQHKAPRTVVDHVIGYIKAKKGLGAKFVAADIFPMKDQRTKEEIPSYQAYLALSWLVQEGVIVKYGREGYALKPTAGSSDQISRLWEALPARD